jgi:hypothetical protein
LTTSSVLATDQDQNQNPRNINNDLRLSYSTTSSTESHVWYRAYGTAIPEPNFAVCNSPIQLITVTITRHCFFLRHMVSGRHASARLLLKPWVGPVVLLLQLGLASAAVSCSLKFEGYGNKQGLKSAGLSCTGGSITAAAHPVLLAPFSRSFSGVSWSDSGGCGRGKKICLLTICGSSSAVFSGAVITNVNISSSAGALLCVTDSSSLVFDSARFHGNIGLPILGDYTAVRLHFENSKFTNNTNIVEGLEGAALHMNGGTGLVHSCTFAGNRNLFRGGAIGLSNQTRLTVASSFLQDNEGGHVSCMMVLEGMPFVISR